MSNPLCVLTPIVGQRSETFIRRHVQDLLPGRTCVVCLNSAPSDPAWSADVPTLQLWPPSRRWPGRLDRYARYVYQRTGGRRAFARFLKEQEVEAILGEYLDFLPHLVRETEASGVRWFGHALGYDVSMRLRSGRWARIYRDSFSHASGVVVVAAHMRRKLIEIGIPEFKISIIPCCSVPLPTLPLREPGPIVKFAAVGRMVPKKAPLLLLESFRKARLESESMALTMIGDGPLLDDAQAYLREYGLEAAVTLMGAQSREAVQSLLLESHAFVQHSVVDPVSGDAEGLPVAILEAMGNGLPVVSTRHAGIPDAVVEGVTGFLVDESDTDAMASGLARLAADPSLRARMGEAAWRRATEKFSWDRERRDLLSLMGL